MADLCVFCGSRVGSRPICSTVAARLGLLLGAGKYTLVYCGGRFGFEGSSA